MFCSKDYSPCWGEVTYPCRDYSRHMFKIQMITKGFSGIVAEDVFVVSLWGRESPPFQTLQGGKQRHIKIEARQPGTPWLHSSSLPGWGPTYCILFSSTLVSTWSKSELTPDGNHTIITSVPKPGYSLQKPLKGTESEKIWKQKVLFQLHGLSSASLSDWYQEASTWAYSKVTRS